MISRRPDTGSPLARRRTTWPERFLLAGLALLLAGWLAAGLRPPLLRTTARTPPAAGISR